MKELLGKRLRSMRLEKNYSQEAVARDLGISPKTLSTWERGTRGVPLENLAVVARYYGIPLSDLVHGLEQGENVPLRIPQTRENLGFGRDL